MRDFAVARGRGREVARLRGRAAFEHAVAEIAHITAHLLEDLVASTPPKDREVEHAKAHARAQARFANA